jgi:hypothetical protein
LSVSRLPVNIPAFKYDPADFPLLGAIHSPKRQFKMRKVLPHDVLDKQITLGREAYPVPQGVETEDDAPKHLPYTPPFKAPHRSTPSTVFRPPLKSVPVRSSRSTVITSPPLQAETRSTPARVKGRGMIRRSSQTSAFTSR